jgi:AcrR family transcriptional regulator
MPRPWSSRATVYRYFEDRDALRVAFVHRETRRIAALVASKIASIDDPAARVVEGIMQSVAEVRARPALHAWFASGNAEVTAELVRASSVIHGLAAGLVGGERAEASYRALWLVRTVVSLLQAPGRDRREERALLDRFVGPVLADRNGSPGRAESPPPRRRR